MTGDLCVKSRQYALPETIKIYTCVKRQLAECAVTVCFSNWFCDAVCNSVIDPLPTYLAN